MKTHLNKFVMHIGGKAVKSAGRYGTFAQHFRKLAETDPIFGDLADVCDAGQADETELAQHCGEFAKALDSTRKAMGGFGDDELMPTEVSAVHGDAPPAALRRVFRARPKRIWRICRARQERPSRRDDSENHRPS